MYYAIHHTTTFRYSQPIAESVMELRLEPRSDLYQRCLRFQIVLSPKARLDAHRDYNANIIHIFDIPGRHEKLAITTESIVEILPPPELPAALSPADWQHYEGLHHEFEFFDMLQAGKYTHPTSRLKALAQELNVIRRADPLTLLREINTALYNAFDYDQTTTDVDSQIDHALAARRGVCQDFVHIMLAMLRGIGIPCRYVSGYLFHRENVDEKDRSAVDATHAWVEAWLPEIGWQGFDPTNNLVCYDRHIRVAYGRDYADVPPTRGVFRGDAETELKVAVHVKKVPAPPIVEEELVSPVDWSLAKQQVQMQQQQQQQ